MRFLCLLHMCKVVFSSRNMSLNKYVIRESIVRILLLLIFWQTESMEPYQRPIVKEIMWQYKYPYYGNTVLSGTVFVIAAVVPAVLVLANYGLTREYADVLQGLLGLSLSCVLNGVVVNIIKLSVGRPRPDYYYRCFPDGEMTVDLQCTGNTDLIREGRKSFPSGHTSWMFAGFGFLSLYLAGKLQTFSTEGKTHSWRLLIVLLPLLAGGVVGFTRIQDNAHHWEDILAGATIGLAIATLCYNHYYHSIFGEDCGLPHPVPSGSNDTVLPTSSHISIRVPSSRTQLAY